MMFVEEDGGVSVGGNDVGGVEAVAELHPTSKMPRVQAIRNPFMSAPNSKGEVHLAPELIELQSACLL